MCSNQTIMAIIQISQNRSCCNSMSATSLFIWHMLHTNHVISLPVEWGYSLWHENVHSTSPGIASSEASHPAAMVTSPPGACLDTLTAPRDRCGNGFHGYSPTTWGQTLRENVSHISYTLDSEASGTRYAVLSLHCSPKLCTGYLSVLSCAVSQLFPLGQWTCACGNRCYDVISFGCLFLHTLENPISVVNKCPGKRESIKHAKHIFILALWHCGNDWWWWEKPQHSFCKL